jgi:phosphoheptose isomerase
MTTQAKPKFEKTVFFNSSFYNTQIDKSLKDYVNYNPTNKKLISNVNYIPTDITSLTLTSIGQNDTINNQFNLPTNTFEANPKSILQLVSNSSRNTQWVTPPTVITDYVNYSNPNLISNVSGTQTNISNLTVGPLICTTIQNNNNTLNCGAITSGSINSGSINANSNLIQTTGSLQSRGLSIKNVSNVDVATISNLGALVCTTIQNNNNTVNCGNITSGTINSGAINANANLIETTGNLQSRGLSIRNTSNTESASISSAGNIIAKSLQSISLKIKDVNNNDIATISNTGDLVCTSIQNNNNTINCGNITSGAINANSNLIETTGSVQSRGLTIQNATPTTTASITTAGVITGTSLSAGTGSITTSGAINGGAITGTSLSAGTGTITTSGAINGGAITGTSISGTSGLISTTGSVQSRGLTIQNATPSTTASITTAGAITGTSLSAGTGSITGGALSCTTITSNNNTITAGTSSVSGGSILSSTFNSSAPGSVLNIGGNQTTGVLSIGNNSGRTGAINIGTLTTGTHAINIGNSASTQTVNINRPLSTNSITTNNNNINAGSGTVFANIFSASGASVLNSGTVSTSIDIGSNQTSGVINIGVNGLRTGNINIGNASTSGSIEIGNPSGAQTVSINRPLTTNTINTNNNTISAGTGAISTTTLNSSTVGGVLDIGANQTTGALSIANNAGRTGAVNIATLTTGANSINIGNSASTQTININRPIRMPGLLYTTGQEIGYSLYNGVFFSSPTNPVLPSTFMNTPIPTANLVNNGNYLINYYLSIVPQANFNVTSFQYGLYSASSFVGGLFQKPSMYSGNTVITSTRFLTSETYTYSGGGFLRYNSASTYTFTFIMDFLATAPIVSTGIEFIRIS